MATRNDVARLAGVSVAVVSYVLNNKSFVKEETRRRVLAAMEELGYTPNLTARSLKTRRSGQLAVLANFIGNPFEAGILLHLEEAARRQGYMINYRSYDPDREPELLAQLAGRVDGVVLLGQSLAEETRASFRKKGVPVVSVMTPGKAGALVHTVDVDWAAAYRQVLAELIRLGHRHIAYMGHGGPSDPLYPRMEAFAAAVQEAEAAAGVTLRCDWLAAGGRYEPAREHLLELPEASGFTVLVCANDLTAIGACSACRERGWAVPERLSIVSSENILMVSETHPPIATLDYPREKAAYLAMELLVRLIGASGKKEESDEVESSAAAVEEIRLASSFIPRSSLAQAPQLS
ncbi:MAG: catabolite control protein [Paenibacillaceae bacterium]|jgi:DNA-binding LacI/PurR family transcriptional regulator|nr:catabolite control protein [Paenibacillaceae bacterium]